jgi:hypothetical protein
MSKDYRMMGIEIGVYTAPDDAMAHQRGFSRIAIIAQGEDVDDRGVHARIVFPMTPAQCRTFAAGLLKAADDEESGVDTTERPI